jgi:hypothetical protein
MYSFSASIMSFIIITLFILAIAGIGLLLLDHYNRDITK